MPTTTETRGISNGVQAAVVVALFLAGCAAENREAELSLLESYMKNFTALAVPSAFKSMSSSLDEQEKRLYSLKGEISEDFFSRYERMLSVTRLTIQPKRNADDLRAIADYIRSVTGQAAPSGDNDLIVAAAFALSEEVLRLDMEVSGESDREKVRKKYADLMRPGK